MTSTERNAPAAPRAAPAPATARWLNMVTTAVIGAVVLIVVAAAAPSLLHAGLSATEEPAKFPPPVRAQQGRPFAPHDHPIGRPPPAPEDDDERDSIDEPPSSRPVSPNDPRQRPPGLPSAADDDDFGLGLRGGVTQRPLPLRDRRTEAVIHEVRAGEKVHILREDGDWLLVFQQSKSDGAVTGWAKRSELRLR